MKKKTKASTQTAIRLEDELLERADRLAERLTQPGRDCNRSDALRIALFKGFDVLEADQKKR